MLLQEVQQKYKKIKGRGIKEYHKRDKREIEVKEGEKEPEKDIKETEGGRREDRFTDWW